MVYADALGSQTAHDDERLEIYRYVVRPTEEGGIEDTAQVPFRGNALHNYAVDLKRGNYLAEAGYRWFESYQLIGQTDRDGNLKSSYSTYLTQDCNNPQAAEIVSNAGALTEPVIATGGRPTPDEFYPGGMLALGLL